MVKARLYLEGGGDSKELRMRCREGFSKLLDQVVPGRKPRLVACGSRNSTFADFKTAHSQATDGEFVAMWVDSEDPLANLDATWQHLQARDGWKAPADATDRQVLFMTTCMETLIVADRAALREHYGAKLQENALPSLQQMEARNRHEVQDALAHATRNCTNKYLKGRRSFEVLSKLKADTLKQHLPSFERATRILDEKL